jgi:hypothetical protein
MNIMTLNKRLSNEGMRSTSIEKHCSRVGINHERTNNHLGASAADSAVMWFTLPCDGALA